MLDGTSSNTVYASITRRAYLCSSEITVLLKIGLNREFVGILGKKNPIETHIGTL